VTAVEGVLHASPAPTGLAVRVRDRAVLARVVERLVHDGFDVFAAVPKPPTLEDVYFAIEARIEAREMTR
jgi:hypothetical protein